MHGEGPASRAVFALRHAGRGRGVPARLRPTRDGRDTALLVALGASGKGKALAPMAGKNVWRLCKTYGRMDTTHIYASIRPAQLKRAVSFYEADAVRGLGGRSASGEN